MTELAHYEGGQAEGYQARMVMAPEDAKALDDQLRACTKAVLREGTDYGVIPGTSGEKVLYRPGAQKLLQWFGLTFTCDRTDIETDLIVSELFAWIWWEDLSYLEGLDTEVTLKGSANMFARLLTRISAEPSR